MTRSCYDAALVMAEVVDSAGAVVPYAEMNVTFTVTDGPGVIAGTSNGDPSCLVNNLSPTRPAFHGLAMAVVLAPTIQRGNITITASADGLTSSELVILARMPSVDALNSKWCGVGRGAL